MQTGIGAEHAPVTLSTSIGTNKYESDLHCTNGAAQTLARLLHSDEFADLGNKLLGFKSPGKIIYRGRTVEFIEGGYFCKIPLKNIRIDADGAPDAYGPTRFVGDRDGCGTDSLINAGYPSNEFDPIPDDWHDILVPSSADPKRPFRKKDGFYISKTSLYDTSIESDRTSGKFVDANLVPYLVMPQFWIDHLGVQLGNLCLLWHARLRLKVVAIVADVCPIDEPLGEMSIAAAACLGGRNVSPRTGVDLPANGSIHCYIFKNTRPDLIWPLTNDLLQSFRDNLEALLGSTDTVT